MSTSPKQALLKEYALVAQALAAPARLMLLEQLAQSEAAVEVLARKTGLTVANASQHLQQLRRAGLVTSRRAGKAVIYRLQNSRSIALLGLLSEMAEANLAQVTDILDGLSGEATAPEPITRADLAERLAAGAVTLLDIRPEDEFAAGHIPGACNMTLADLDRLLPTLDPKAEVVAYCRGPYCIYAHQAVARLRQNGFNARRMQGGLPEWREDGRGVCTGQST
ncbi:metalloregulator ArsR/SmtB family transcription factor [Roseovarius gahaiensis]|uniref:Metalloregulator ArsR/SmtB family transcription factor n=1 Tax=Roseovarius gahaiensis TaxID=2716691 RepID=A0A967BGB8_9RHOB|nr:metalloregulator ArsR/SmtB family transcription factor [Roseovarius gahaiensis]NHQ75989.1 metalloregulator ArsR/SmtB family transcription factor [Roseovarius gahaiensis]